MAWWSSSCRSDGAPPQPHHRPHQRPPLQRPRLRARPLFRWHTPPGRPDGVYDWGGPDHVEGEKANLKWRLICQGVEALIERDGLAADDVSVWIDWQVRALAGVWHERSPRSHLTRVRHAQSIHQDEPEIKAKGVVSLIKYATLSSYMLVPLDQAELTDDSATYPEDIPNYGERGWCE